MKDGVTEVKQYQSDRDGKGPSRLCPGTLAAHGSQAADVAGETAPPTVFCDILDGEDRWPCKSWLLDTQEGEQQPAGARAHRAGALHGLGHSTARSWPGAKASLGPSSARADRTLRSLLLEQDQQQLLSSAHFGLWQESSLVMSSAVPAPGLPGPAKGKWEGETAPGEASAPFPLCKKWELRHSLDLSVQFCAGVKS